MISELLQPIQIGWIATHFEWVLHACRVIRECVWRSVKLIWLENGTQSSSRAEVEVWSHPEGKLIQSSRKSIHGFEETHGSNAQLDCINIIAGSLRQLYHGIT